MGYGYGPQNTIFLAVIGAMMRDWLAAVLVFSLGTACSIGTIFADPIRLPLPRPKFESAIPPGHKPLFVNADVLDEPTPCFADLQSVAVAEPITLLNGTDVCIVDDMVRLKAIRLPGNRQIAVTPHAELRCPMAASLAAWVRDDLSVVLSEPGLAGIVSYNAYECRSRNRIAGAKLSEHAKGNALDIRAFMLTDRKIVDPTSVYTDRVLRERIHATACARFTTVLGPGSDGYHEQHIHVDIAQRRNGFRTCLWQVREPAPVAAVIPVPRPRPAIPGDAGGR
jgi:hypothetical protein